MAVRVVVVMKLHLLSSITVLPPPHEKAEDGRIIEDWSRGLDWVKWLLGSVRARTELLMVDGDSASLSAAWEEFTEGRLREVIGPALKAAWRSAHAGDLDGLIAADTTLSAGLSDAAARRSARAGAVLLKSTKNARYQAVLGRLREAVEQGRCEGHIAVVWAAVGHFFQLSLTNVIAEYLLLEWDIVTRDEPSPEPPVGKFSIAGLTSQIMHEASAEPALRVVDA